MQSSYKGIVKGDSIDNQGPKKIFTDIAEKKKKIHENGEGTIEKNESILKSYENLGASILEDANKKKETIISEAYEKAAEITKEAYDEGYKSGQEEGYKAAYDDGYTKNLDKAKKEAEVIRKNADNVLHGAFDEKNKYLKEKEIEIKNMVLNAIESILKHEVKDEDSLNEVVFESLKEMRKSKTFIIKSREKYCSEFRKKIDVWKEQLPFKGDIFIIPDESIEEGSVIIEMDNGKMNFGVDTAYEKIKSIFKDGE